MRMESSRGSLLRQNRPFRWLWCSRTISFIGGSTGMVGILLHLADTNEAVAAVTLLMLCGDFAPALLAPLIGVLADRVDLKRLMLICEIGQAAATVVIAIWLPSLPLFLALFTLRAVLGQIFQPASRTAVPTLVRDADLESANAHLGFGEHGLPVLGPLLAAAFAVGFVAIHLSGPHGWDTFNEKVVYSLIIIGPGLILSSLCWSVSRLETGSSLPTRLG